MLAYVGQTRSRRLIAKLEAHGIGEVTQRNEWPPRRRPWVLDNGAFSDWRSGRPFNSEVWSSACAWANAQLEADRPAWTVCPDRVATGLESLAFSLDWLEQCGTEYPALRWYLAVQDGMTAEHVSPVVPGRFVGLFVGGTLPWKIATGASWVRLAHQLGVPCHVGRVGTVKRVAWARRIGADSIDSCLPLWSEQKLDAFLEAVGSQPRRQLELAVG